MIDTVRVAELNNELGVVQDTIQRAEQRAGEIIAELRAMLDSQPGQESTPAVGPTARSASSGSPAPVSQPGSARVGQRERRERGRRAPATMAAPIAATSEPVGTTTPASSHIECPECGEPVTARGLGVHRSRSKAHAAAVNAKARHVVGLPVVTRRPAPAERNPRSAPPLDLAPRLDQAVGE